MAAIKAEEEGGGPDWEERIPQIVGSLQSDDPSQLVTLLKQLTPELEEQRKMRNIDRDQFQRYTEDEALADCAMCNEPEARVPVGKSGGDLVYTLFWKNWEPLFRHLNMIDDV